LDADKITIRMTCGKCGASNSFSLADIDEVANLPPGVDKLTHEMTNPCEECGEPLAIEVELELSA
jgi:transcription elongation factor Elf1